MSDQKSSLFSSRQLTNVLLAILCLLAVGYILSLTRSLLIPLAVAVVLRFLLNPAITFFEKRGVPEIISIFLATTTAFLALLLIGTLVGNSIANFGSAFPKYEPRLNALLDRTLGFFNLSTDFFSTDWQEHLQIGQLLEQFSIAGTVTSILGAISKFLSNTFLVLLFLLFMLMARNQLSHKLEIAFEKKTASKISNVLGNINQDIQKYLVMKTLISLLTATLVSIVLFFFNVEFVLVWGILTFLLNFIPSVGSLIATVLPLTIATIQFESFITVGWLAMLIFAIQFAIGNILEPRVLGSSLNLSPLVVLMALIFWGWMWGIIGMFLAVPFMVIIKIILENIDELKFLSILMSGNAATTDQQKATAGAG